MILKLSFVRDTQQKSGQASVVEDLLTNDKNYKTYIPTKTKNSKNTKKLFKNGQKRIVWMTEKVV